MKQRALIWLCLTIRAVPRRYRFGLLRALARGSRPVVASTPMCRRRVSEGMDTAREVTLYKFLEWVTRTRTEFDLPLIHEGIDHLDRALADGRGTLVACVHGLLNHAMYRFLSDYGVAARGLALAATPVLGTRVLPRLVSPSAMQLRDAQRLLRDGGILCAMLDRSERSKRSVDLVLRRGSLRINDALFRVAASSGANIVFCSTRVDERYRIVMTWHAPDRASDLTGVVASFGTFLTSVLPGQRQGRDLNVARAPC